MTREPDAGDVVLTPLALERSGTPTQPVIVALGEIDVATSPLLRSELAAVLTLRPTRSRSIYAASDSSTLPDSESSSARSNAFARPTVIGS